MSYKPHPPPAPLLIGYDPVTDLPQNHLARLVDRIVDDSITVRKKIRGRGQPAYDPRLCIKVLVYAYATGVRSSRQMDKMCKENLPFLFLSRGLKPSYRTLCTARVQQEESMKLIWIAVLGAASASGIKRIGRITLDSTKVAANAGPDSIISAKQMKPLLQMLEQIVKEHEQTDLNEEEEYSGGTVVTEVKDFAQMRDIARGVVQYIQEENEEAKTQGEQTGTGDANPPKPSNPIDPNAAIGSLFEEPIEDMTEQEDNDPPPSSNAPLVEQEANHAGEEAKKEIQSSSTVRKYKLTSKMRKLAVEAIEVLKSAIANELGHVSLTDPDARMMCEGSHKRLGLCHSHEVAVDNGYIVAGGGCSTSSDSPRLLGLVEQAKLNEPDGVHSVDADSGYYGGHAVGTLLEEGIDVCIPTNWIACDLKRGLPLGTTINTHKSSVPMTFVPEKNHFVCPEGNVLGRDHIRHKVGTDVTVYKAKRLCTGCKLAAECLSQPNAKRRTMTVPIHSPLVKENLDRFEDKEHKARYHQRGPAVETVFAVLRRVMGFNQWSVRGTKRIQAESQIVNAAYQLRKLQALTSPPQTKRQMKTRQLQILQVGTV